MGPRSGERGNVAEFPTARIRARLQWGRAPESAETRSARQFFAQGGGPALADYRKQQAREQERERKRQRQMALMVLDDPESSEAEMAWAREILAGA